MTVLPVGFHFGHVPRHHEPQCAFFAAVQFCFYGYCTGHRRAAFAAEICIRCSAGKNAVLPEGLPGLIAFTDFVRRQKRDLRILLRFGKNHHVGVVILERQLLRPERRAGKLPQAFPASGVKCLRFGFRLRHDNPLRVAHAEGAFGNFAQVFHIFNAPADDIAPRESDADFSRPRSGVGQRYFEPDSRKRRIFHVLRNQTRPGVKRNARIKKRAAVLTERHRHVGEQSAVNSVIHTLHTEKRLIVAHEPPRRRRAVFYRLFPQSEKEAFAGFVLKHIERIVYADACEPSVGRQIETSSADTAQRDAAGADMIAQRQIIKISALSAASARTERFVGGGGAVVVLG